ncbi:MAG: hypothetical protein IMZ46_02280 [Acidobacteria bacterium]|nr:hypothetical protein [Acidobacteriota bacterium]
MQSNIFNLDWEKFDYKDKEQRMKLAGALQMFLALPDRFMPKQFSKVQAFVKAHQEMKAKQVREFTLMSDGYPNEKAIDVVEKFHLVGEYDTGFEQIFAVNDYAGSKASGFDVAGVTSGLSFREIKPGEKLKVYGMSGDKYRCFFCYYGGALGWHRQLFEDGDWWTIEDNAIEFRAAAYGGRAGIYYALLEAAMDAIGCCATIDAGEVVNADAHNIAAALNFAAVTILENTAGRGYNLNPQTVEFIVLTPLRMRGRVRLALNLVNQNFQGAAQVIDFNFRQVTSLMLTNQNRVAVILPKRTLKIGYRMDLTNFSDFDILSYTETVAGWMRHGGCIGDLDQIACIEFEPTSGSCPNPHLAPIAACGKVVDEHGDEIGAMEEGGFEFVSGSGGPRDQGQ